MLIAGMPKSFEFYIPEEAVNARLERFRAKWTPVRVKKTCQNKKLEPRSDSIRTEKALVVMIILLGIGVLTLDRYDV
jgi:hypothetical protein